MSKAFIKVTLVIVHWIGPMLHVAFHLGRINCSNHLGSQVLSSWRQQMAPPMWTFSRNSVRKVFYTGRLAMRYWKAMMPYLTVWYLYNRGTVNYSPSKHWPLTFQLSMPKVMPWYWLRVITEYDARDILL